MPENWQSISNIKRSFVRHINPGIPHGDYFRIIPENLEINLSVIIPTSDAFRDGYYYKLLDQITCQHFSGFEIIVIRGDSRQGRAINIGAALAKGKYLLTLDDDTALPDPETFNKLIGIMDTYPEIGIAGGNNVIPEVASPFVRRVMKQIPRRSWKSVQAITDSDLAEHPCMIVRTKEFKAVGGENELIPRGLDPYLREQFRLAGKRVVVVPGVLYHHLPPDSLAKLLRQFYRNGRQASYTKRRYPQWIIETPDKHGQFKMHISFIARIFRFPVRLAKALVSGKLIWFLIELAYAVGYIRDMLFERPLKGG